MQIVRENIEKLETQLLHWDRRLDLLIAKAEAVRTEAKSDRLRHIDELKAKSRSAKAKLYELKAARSEKWDILKTGVESAWNELEIAFKKLKD